MDKRLQQFLSAENITQSQFADSIGVAKASVSHILAGRNKPGFEFIEGMARRYPDLSLEWLITGKGKMYKSQQEVSNPLPSSTVQEEETLFPMTSKASEASSEVPENSKSERNSGRPVVSRILVLYDDGTYKEV